MARPAGNGLFVIDIRRFDLRFFSSLPRRLVDQKVVEFLAFFDRRNEPSRSSAASCPCLAFRTPIFRRDLPALQCASPTTTTSNLFTAKQVHPLQLFLELGATLMQHYVDPLSQLHKGFNIDP
jgi:hypothetical protein